MDTTIRRCRVEGCNSIRGTQQLCGVRYAIQYNYKLTPEMFADLVELQGGVCAICGEPPVEGRRLEVDHDHNCCPTMVTCGLCLRGLVCRRCNLAIATFERLGFERLISYLTGPPAAQLHGRH